MEACLIDEGGAAPCPRILVIVPAYNEEASIATLLQRFETVRRGLPNLDLLVVDDGSIDGTVSEVRAATAEVLAHGHAHGDGGHQH